MSEATPAKIRLNIITPCSRPIYLPIIACQLRSFTKISVHWHVGYDIDLNQSVTTGHNFGHNFQTIFNNAFASDSAFITIRSRTPETSSHKGTGQRNEALEGITIGDEWVAFLDDDTLLPPGYEDTVVRAIHSHPDAEGFIFEQVDKKNCLRVRVSSTPPRSFIQHLYEASHLNGKDGCDTGQMLFKRSLIGTIRWKHHSAADHEFYKEVAFNPGNQSKVRWMTETASIHNALR